MKFIAHTGNPVPAESPDRLMWYGLCNYWTDDWDKVKRFGPGIPCCPICGAPGFQNVMANWDASAQEFQDNGHPDYVKFLNEVKESCLRGKRMSSVYRMWLEVRRLNSGEGNHADAN